MRSAQTAFVTVALLLFVFGTLGPARAEDDPAAMAGEDEPELEGAAKAAHNKEVKALVKYLHKEKIWTYVQHKIDELGGQRTRVARDTLMRYVATNKNSERINYALKALAKIPGKKTIDFLCGKDALNSKKFLVQISAAEALEYTKDKRGVKPLLKVMTSKRTKTKVICSCALALARIAPEDEEVIATLLEYSYHKKDTVSAYVTTALGYIKTDEALERLVDALHNDSNTRVREYAASALQTNGRPEALNELRKAWIQEKTVIVRNAIQRAIRSLEGS